MEYQERIEKYQVEIISYLERYSSESESKSISEIAEVLSLDVESVGAVIHELLTLQRVSTDTNSHWDGFRYYIKK